MGKEELQKLALLMQQEIRSLEHGEIHITLKIRDKHLALIENTKIVKENLSDSIWRRGENTYWPPTGSSYKLA